MVCMARRRPQRWRSGQSTWSPPSASPSPQSCRRPSSRSSRPSRQAPSASATAATSGRRFSPGSGGWRPSCGRTQPQSSGRRWLGRMRGSRAGLVPRNILAWCASPCRHCRPSRFVPRDLSRLTVGQNIGQATRTPGRRSWQPGTRASTPSCGRSSGCHTWGSGRTWGAGRLSESAAAAMLP